MTSENEISKQIKSLRSKMGWSQSQLADKLNVSKQSVSNWETGLKTPRMGALQKMSDLFGVSIGRITDGETNSSDLVIKTSQLMKLLSIQHQQEVYEFTKSRLSHTSPNTVIFPSKHNTTTIEVDGVLSAGVGEYLDNNSEPFPVTVPAPVPDNYDYAFKINGSSMEPYYHDGQVVFIKKVGQYRDGQTVAAIYDGCAYLKRLAVDDDGYATLVSLNPDYPNVRIDDKEGMKLLGVAFS
ncbi:XRE family transcriptional regulator [Levilactobacillus brevis]|uniref:XRE family transcriptional regulator n=1 Tax=Levilactobacillus brevis TaxID=1580 RepID=UPI0007602A91|nr:XRE family transcriptional regulator [Levilactobacillus brevis]MCT3566522.1 LexA family transcriptional regulator [Levilactobacillus brevis]ORJ54207.1 hypothetical protein LBR_09800 [Levilactobacillus brevis]